LANAGLQAPSDTCWPTERDWDTLNSTVEGRLLSTQPVARACYPGSEQDSLGCEIVDESWSDSVFQASNPVGLSYPINITCAPVNASAGEQPGSCVLGRQPLYAVNATNENDVIAAVTFASRNNIRVVIKETGHDILGRSEGGASLLIWTRYLRNGVEFIENYYSPCTADCDDSQWSGAAIHIDGGYTWSDVYPVAEANGKIVVGGGTPSVSSTGGWMQGGGHGPASRQFGLGADQVLSARVVLADGCIITASPCENQDIYFAIRGGGPGTYGVVLSTTIKAWPMVDVKVQSVAIAPLTSNNSALFDAITTLYSAYPDLNDAGYAGYGTWSTASPTPIFANFTTAYVHGFYTFNKTMQETQEAFASTLKKLLPQNGTSLFVSVSYSSFDDYWSFYNAVARVEPPVGTTAALGSRLFSRASVQNDTAGLRNMLEVVSGEPEEFTSNNFELISGGQVFKDASDPFSGLNPVWRKSYFNHIVARGWAPGSSEDVKTAVQRDITYNKVPALQKQAPDTGVYMNEADRLDPDWQVNFYGEHYERLLEIKQRRDPDGVFYCPTCVGSAEWAEDEEGRLCRIA
jgi:FAD/FMN-containing dehydrogenase